jgi:hypothetical protein
MAINFPNNPTVNDTHTVGDTTWTWDGTTWLSSASSYVLPTATTTTLGGVKVDGTTVTINNGTISSPESYTLPTATTTTLGGVKVDGTTVTINNGTISSTASGDVNKAASSTDNAIVRFDGTSGDTLQNSLVTVSDTGQITAPAVGNVIPFYYANTGDFPTSDSNNHGAIAHSHADESMFFSHGGNWVEIANRSDVKENLVSLNDIDSVTNSPATTSGLVLLSDGNNGYGFGTYTPTINRSTVAVTTGSLADGNSSTHNLTGFKSYYLLKITTNAAAWVILYTDTASRTSDYYRSILTDPSPNSGVIAEAITLAADTIKFTPGILGWNNDTVPSTNIYARVYNRSGIAQAITVTFTIIPVET